MTRRLGVLAAVTAVAVVLLWLVPPVGLLASAALLVIVPPWGRTLTERAVVSGVVVLGIVAVVFPRAGAVPVTSVSVRILLTAMLVGALALRMLPALRDQRIPRPTVADGVVGVLAVLSGWWLMAAYIGRSAVEIVSGLFFTGWDNQGHFTTFANTYAEQSTTWPTVDGSTAWNQWYPSLQTTVMAMAEQAWAGSGLDRIGLLWPYVQWNAVLFALSLAGLAWVAGDVAARIGGRGRASWAAPLGAAVLAGFALFGSPAQLYNRGFTNFVMGVTVVVVVAWLSARSWRSARTLGWFLIPLGTIAVIGLWTPLALGLVPSGIVVAIALLKHRRWMGLAWLGTALVVGGFLAATQLQAIIGVDPEQGADDFAQNLGSIDVGMSPFNVGAALLAPVIVVLIAVLLIQQRRWPTPAAVVGPVLGFAAVALVFTLATDAAETSRLQSYYVLKPLNGVLLAVAPLVAGIVAVAVVRALDGLPRATRAVGVALSAVIVAGLFGYVGALPAEGVDGIGASAGVEAASARSAGVANSTIGEVIVRSAEAAVPYPQDATFVWNGSGTLPNLWVASLHGVMSRDQQTFYLSVPTDPYDAKTLAYIDLILGLKPQMSFAVLWFTPSAEPVLTEWAAGKDRVELVQVPMPSNGACPECSL